jgi:hypothetical protein
MYVAPVAVGMPEGIEPRNDSSGRPDGKGCAEAHQVELFLVRDGNVDNALCYDYRR